MEEDKRTGGVNERGEEEGRGEMRKQESKSNRIGDEKEVEGG